MTPDNELDPKLYEVARDGPSVDSGSSSGTEAPFSGKFWNNHESGMYKCAVCGAELFSSDTKFDSGTDWPSFTDPVNLKNVELREDEDGLRTEVLCKKCGAHLGHVFDDGPIDKNLPPERQGKRYCINSVCLNFAELTLRKILEIVI